MTEMTEFTIGAEASCSDGVCGKVTRVVVNPVARTVTHLVVEPTHRQGEGRLVPLDLVGGGNATVQLRCTLAEFTRLELAEDTEFLAGPLGYAGYGPDEMMSWPYYGLGGMTTGGMPMGTTDVPQAIITDKVPLGEVEVRRGQHVHATDGSIGKVQGLVIDPADHHVTHVLLQEGHLWGRKEVAIPIGAVSSVTDGIRLTMSKQEVADLPPVDVAHPTG